MFYWGILILFKSLGIKKRGKPFRNAPTPYKSIE